MRLRFVVLTLVLLSFAQLQAQTPAAKPSGKTRNVIFVMTDGLRWQEVFRGVDPSLLVKENHADGDAADEIKKLLWRDTAAERREALMPFLWGVVAKQGQIYGDQDLGSEAHVTNGMNFSYPGYSETFCGYPDARIDSNKPHPNPNVTLFEWLNNKPAYKGRVAVFGAWSVIGAAVNPERSGLVVNVGYDPFTMSPMTPELETLNKLKGDSPRMWDDEPFDNLTFHTAMLYLKEKKPRVFYLSLGETDDWAHMRIYGEYLRSAHRADEYLRQLWETVQSMPEYKDNTTLVFLPDHGRGSGVASWGSHGKDIDESKSIWIAIMGPDTPALGDRKGVTGVTQSQVAATVAKLLGEDYNAAQPKAAAPIADAIAH